MNPQKETNITVLKIPSEDESIDRKFSTKKRILIIGASGFIGRSVYRYLKKNLHDKFEITGTYCSSKSPNDLERLDITSFEDLENFLLQYVPDFVLLLAGTKNVQECEDNYSSALILNTQPSISLINIISNHKLHTRVIFFSTDYIFDGKRGGYKETDLPNPQTNYGKTKFLAEKAFLDSNINYKIIRTAAVMGKGGTFFDWLLTTMQKEREIVMYNNIFFTPTPLGLLNESIASIIKYYDKIDQKILHIVGERKLSRYQFALMVKKYLNSECSIIAEEKIDNNLLFQNDLSLIPSDIINNWKMKSFEEYLKDEIQHAAFCE